MPAGFMDVARRRDSTSAAVRAVTPTLCTGFGKPDGDGPADAAPAAGHQGDAILQGKHERLRPLSVVRGQSQADGYNDRVASLFYAATDH